MTEPYIQSFSKKVQFLTTLNLTYTRMYIEAGILGTQFIFLQKIYCGSYTWVEKAYIFQKNYEGVKGHGKKVAKIRKLYDFY